MARLDLILGWGILVMIVGSIIVLTVFTAFVSMDQQSSYSNTTMTSEQAKYEYCLLVTQLKYPTSSTEIVERLCELEQIGRLKG